MSRTQLKFYFFNKTMKATYTSNFEQLKSNINLILQLNFERKVEN